MKRRLATIACALLLAASAPAIASYEAPDSHPLTPEQQQTRSQIYSALHIGAAATAIGLVSLIVFLLHRERRARGKEAAP